LSTISGHVSMATTSTDLWRDLIIDRIGLRNSTLPKMVWDLDFLKIKINISIETSQYLKYRK